MRLGRAGVAATTAMRQKEQRIQSADANTTNPRAKKYKGSLQYTKPIEQQQPSRNPDLPAANNKQQSRPESGSQPQQKKVTFGQLKPQSQEDRSTDPESGQNNNNPSDDSSKGQVPSHVHNQGRIAQENEDLVRDGEFEDNTHLGVTADTEDTIVFKSYPWAPWIAGLLIICAGIYLTVYLLFTKEIIQHQRESGHRGPALKDTGLHWWQWLVTIGIIALGVIFIISGEIKTMMIDKQMNLIERRKTNLCCRKKVLQRQMTDITNIVSVKKGHEGINYYTLEYTIRAEFRHHQPMVILTSTSHKKIVQQFMLVRNFIGVSTKEEDVRMRDYSTRI